jgi:hypothetical protein
VKTVTITFNVGEDLEARIKELGSSLTTEGGSVIMRSVQALRQSSDNARRNGEKSRALTMSDLANVMVLGNVMVK